MALRPERFRLFLKAASEEEMSSTFGGSLDTHAVTHAIYLRLIDICSAARLSNTGKNL
jgi:hypothetical protein